MGGLKGWVASLPGNRPFPALFALFRVARRAVGKSRKRKKKAFFPRYPRICLNPYLLNPHLRHSHSITHAKVKVLQFVHRNSRGMHMVRRLIPEATTVAQDDHSPTSNQGSCISNSFCTKIKGKGKDGLISDLEP